MESSRVRNCKGFKNIFKCPICRQKLVSSVFESLKNVSVLCKFYGNVLTNHKNKVKWLSCKNVSQYDSPVISLTEWQTTV